MRLLHHLAYVRIGARTLIPAAFLAVVAVAGFTRAANATGTVLVQQRDGSTKTYHDVRIHVQSESMWITSRDGKGTIVLGKAACMEVGELLRCVPYDATLFQNGETRHIALQSGTVWVNPSKTMQQLTDSSTQLPPRGVLLAVKTKAGTYVTLSGIVDEIQK